MVALNCGESKVAEKGHTLILGWNESTSRVVVQMAFLRHSWHSSQTPCRAQIHVSLTNLGCRRGFQIQNEPWEKFFFPWTRVKPSTPAACAPVVILTGISQCYFTRDSLCNIAVRIQLESNPNHNNH